MPSFLLHILLLASLGSTDKLILTEGTTPDGARYEIQVRTEKDGSQTKQGSAKYYSASGQLKLSGRFSKGLRTGKWEAWYPGGIRSWTGNYKKGLRCKKWQLFTPTGTQVDRMSGDWQLIDRSGFSGAVRMVGYEVNGTPQGFWRIDWWNGELFAEGDRVNGLREGEWTTHHPDGSPAPRIASGLFAAGEWVGPLGNRANSDRWLLSDDLPAPKAYKWSPYEKVKEAQGLIELLDQLEKQPIEMGSLSTTERDSLLTTFQQYFGGHGFGWSWGAHPDSSGIRTQALKSARTLATLLGDDRPYWSWPGGGVIPPSDPLTVSPYFRSLSIFKGSQGTDFPIAESVYGARSSRPRMTKRKARNSEGQAIDTSLEWLAAAQHPSGLWTAIDSQYASPGRYNVGLTGLALLAFLGAEGHALNGPHSSTIIRGLKALIRLQGKDGAMQSKRGSMGANYEHSMATMALAEAYATSGHGALRQPVRRALDYLARIRSPYAGWRYDSEGLGDADTSVTAWAYQALFAGHTAGFRIDPLIDTNVNKWLDSVTDTSTGRVGYIGPEPGSRSSRIEEVNGHFPPIFVEPMTAAGLTIKRLFGLANSTTKLREALCEKHEDLLNRVPLSWENSRQDSYYAFYGTLAGGIPGSHRGKKSPMHKWRKRAVALIVSKQVKRGEKAGSWDPTDAWGLLAGRVYTTAMYTLSLENAYRFRR